MRDDVQAPIRRGWCRLVGPAPAYTARQRMFCLIFRVMVTDQVPLALVAARRCPVLIWMVISAREIGFELVVSVSLPLKVMRFP